MNFDQLFAFSEPKRILRSRTVRGPALDIEAYRGEMFYFFNFKAFPSTEQRRHKGYIKFHRPGNPRTPLERVPCEVDCDCKDFRYRWAWAIKQRGSSRVGPGSLNKALNRAPRETNPSAVPGLCKHLLALRNFLYGQNAQFPAADEEFTTSDRLERMVKAADKKTISLAGTVARRDDAPAAEADPEVPETEPAADAADAEQEMRDRSATQAPTVRPRESVVRGMDAVLQEVKSLDAALIAAHNKVARLIEDENGQATPPAVAAAPAGEAPEQLALTALQSMDASLKRLVDLIGGEGKLDDKDLEDTTEAPVAPPPEEQRAAPSTL